MSFLQSPLSFGGYTFPYGIRLMDRQQDARIDSTPIPFTPGVNAPPGVEDKRLIHLTGQIGGDGAVDSSGAYITTRDQCEAEVQLMASYLASGYQQFAMGLATNPRYCMAQKSKLKASYVESQNGKIAHIDIELLVEDPRWLSTVTHSMAGSGPPGVSITNAGSGVSFPKYTFTASTAATIPYIKVVLPGLSTYIETAPGATMAIGDTLIIDCDPRNRANAVTLNGVARLDLLGTSGCVNTVGDAAFFPYLLPGTSTITACPSTGSGTSTVTWQDAWVF